MALLMSGWVQRSTSAVRGDTGGWSCLSLQVATERRNDGGSSLLGMVVWGSWVAAASAKVGRRSAMAMRTGRSVSSLEETEEWWELTDDSFDVGFDIYL